MGFPNFYGRMHGDPYFGHGYVLVRFGMDDARCPMPYTAILQPWIHSGEVAGG